MNRQQLLNLAISAQRSYLLNKQLYERLDKEAETLLQVNEKLLTRLQEAYDALGINDSNG